MDVVANQNSDKRWQAVVRSDVSANGQFVYCVRSTGIYCRPSCTSRLPKRENVEFHADCASAERAGFRPCKRCRPDEAFPEQRQAQQIAKACRLIEGADELPSLDALSEAIGISRFHFHRLFKAVTGLTPKAYGDAHRARRVRDALAKGGKVTEAVFESGFNSSARFYAQSSDMLGMTPSRFRAGGKGERVRFALGRCSLGNILVAASEKGVCAITLGEDPEELLRDLQDRFPKAELIGADKGFEDWVAKIVGFVEAPHIGLDLPLDIRGSAFQLRVWQALRDIPVGATVSYSEIAEKIGAPKAVRAVASACAANALAVAIPCHRVVARSGAMSGYRWGVERKQALLKRERGN